MPEVLSLSRVTHRFADGPGVEDLSLGVERGEVVAVIGLNGAGKTTLMRLALGMLRPASGRVELFGQELRRLPRPQFARVGALIEVPLAYPELTARQNLRLSGLLRGASAEATDRALEVWRLRPVARRRFGRLSLGNRQRVGLAVALQHHPDLVVLDEPSNALDPLSVVLLREQLAEAADRGAGVLVSSHHLDEVARMADRVLLINRGRLIGQLDPAGIDLERVFFECIRADDENRVEPEVA